MPLLALLFALLQLPLAAAQIDQAECEEGYELDLATGECVPETIELSDTTPTPAPEEPTEEQTPTPEAIADEPQVIATAPRGSDATATLELHVYYCPQMAMAPQDLAWMLETCAVPASAVEVRVESPAGPSTLMTDADGMARTDLPASDIGFDVLAPAGHITVMIFCQVQEPDGQSPQAETLPAGSAQATLPPGSTLVCYWFLMESGDLQEEPAPPTPTPTPDPHVARSGADIPKVEPISCRMLEIARILLPGVPKPLPQPPLPGQRGSLDPSAVSGEPPIRVIGEPCLSADRAPR